MHLLFVHPVLPRLENGPAGIFLRLVQALHLVHHDLAVEAVLDTRGSLVQRPTAGGTSSVIMAVPVTARHFGFGTEDKMIGFSRWRLEQNVLKFLCCATVLIAYRICPFRGASSLPSDAT